MASTINNEADAIFTNNWNVYNKLVDHNYMFHLELTASTQKAISELTGKPLKVLDLGCGDAALFSKLLKDEAVISYTGYDTSAEVLQLAARSLEAMQAETRLVNDYLQHATTLETGTFNLIHSSFAVHHLTYDQKVDFFTATFKRLLEPDGVFVYVDVMRDDEQSRVAYLEAYLANVASRWTALTADEYQLVEDHIRSYDFPMEKRELKVLLKEIGYHVSEPITVDRAHNILVLRK